MAHTAGPSISASASYFILQPLPIVNVSCSAEYIDTESGPVLSPEGLKWHIPLGKVYVPLPVKLSSVNSPSYLAPA